MTGDARVMLIGGGGLSALLVGLLMHVSSLLTMSDAADAAERYAGYLEHLDAYEQDATADASVIAAWEALAAEGEATSLDAVVDRRLAGRNATLERKAVEVLMEDWQLERVHVVIPDVPIDAAMAFVSDAESVSPPWRMVACDIRPGSAHAGRGDVKLELIRIAHAGP